MAVRGINKVILVGRLGKDPEVRYIPNGGAVANLQVATSETWRDKQTGEMREQTEWHRVVLFGKLAEVAGEYGQYFNSDEPSLRDDAKMVVLELGGLEDRPSLLVAVMFSLIIYIENRMYRTPRNLKKLNVIDEGWRLLDFKNHKVGEFIEKGYRTARRHTGAYITITQNIVDFDSDKASSAARAAWGNSSYKIILKQSAKEFAKYNQLYPDQFLPLQRDMIGKFGAAKDQWFSSFLLQVENHSSWHRLFVDPLSRAMYSSDGPDFEFVQQKRKEGLSIHEAVWQLAWKKSGPEMASLEAWLEEHEKYRSVA